MIEHPEFASHIPPGAQVVVQVESDEAFNMWARSVAQRQREDGQVVVCVRVKGVKPVHSRLEEPVIQEIA